MTRDVLLARHEALSLDELDALEVIELPDREALSLVNGNIAAPVNAALGLNVASDGSQAMAVAHQTAPIGQAT